MQRESARSLSIIFFGPGEKEKQPVDIMKTWDLEGGGKGHCRSFFYSPPLFRGTYFYQREASVSEGEVRIDKLAS